MNSKMYFTLLFILIAFGCAQQQNESISDLIQPVNIKDGKSVKVVISDLFYVENYDVQFFPNDNFDVAVNKDKGTLEIIPNENFSGLDLLSFSFNNENYELPVKHVLRNKYLFKYRPGGDPK
ncbi:MAG: hypothetical protein JSW63_01345, partial [Ignavibacterium sp.]